MTHARHHLACLALALAAAIAGADSIALRRSVTVEPDAPITLADVADLDGPAAERLGDLILADTASSLPRTPDGARSLDVSRIRERLDGHHGVNWAFLTLRGAGVRLTEVRPPQSVTAAPNTGRETGDDPDAPQPIVPGTIRELAHRVLLSVLKVGPDELRVRWPDRDAELLDQPVAGRAVHVQPVGRSSRIPLSVTIYEGDRIVRTETVRAELTVRRRVSVVARPVQRGEKVAAGDITPRTMWVNPDVDPAGAVVGEVTTRRLDPGAIVESGDVAPPIAIGRGEVVMLHCVAGAVALRTPARALADGAAGEVIELEMQATGTRVTARVSGPGRAVLVVPTAAQASANKGVP